MSDVGGDPLFFSRAHDVLENAAGQLRQLPHNTVHIWAFELNCKNAVIYEFHRTLSDQERLRSQRFQRERDRSEFIVSRGIVRGMLAQYCGISANELRFANSITGKPKLVPTGAMSICPTFNLSHSNGRMLLAIAASLDVGIDLELEQRVSPLLEIARRFFSVREFEMMMAFPEAQRQAVFFRHWVAKEAALKGSGAGLTLPTESMTIEWDQSKRAAQMVFSDPQPYSGGWEIRLLDCELGWHAAISTNAEKWTISAQSIYPRIGVPVQLDKSERFLGGNSAG